MNTKQLPLVPMIFTGAGACLTLENWQEVGVRAISCALSALLFKPGLNMLFQIHDLHAYLGWSETLIINADLPFSMKDSSYILYSPHDGSKLTLSSETFQALITHLKADYCILPQSDKTALPFIESNQPAEEAFAGKMYTQNGIIDLYNAQNRTQFLPLDKACQCPTCKQGFTRAYLHHLLTNTPLLAQRFLIMHNVYFVNNCKKI